MPSSNNRNKVDEIKNRLDIVDVIRRDVELHHKGGGEYTGATSSTSKSGASLKVNQNLQSFNNWATGDKGDVLDWIGYTNRLDTRGADFPEVLRIGAELAGVELELGELTDEERNAAMNAAKEKADVHNLLTDATEIYYSNLKSSPELYDYIKEKWGIDQGTVDKYRIGYATPGRDLKELAGDTLNKSGLIYVNDGKPGGEVFRGRIIFPYWKNGKVVYLIGRGTEETPEAEREKRMKYKKLLVHKERQEYVSPSVQNSYFFGEDSLRGFDYCIITEGVTDCIVMLQAGFPCISPVTVQFRDQDHPKLVSLTKRLKRVYICNDNETNQAGLKGALRTAEALERAGVEARLIKLPKPEDVDKIDIAEYMITASPDDFRGLMDSSLRLCYYLLEQQVIPGGSKSPDRLRAFKAFISDPLDFMPDDEWEVFVYKEVQEHFRLGIKYIKTAVEEAERERGRRKQNETEGQADEPEDQTDEPEDNLNRYPEIIREQAYKILSTGDPFKFILDVWQRKHVGDTNIGENCLCSSVSRVILNSRRGLHIKPSGESGKGKSDAIECFLELLPEGSYITGSMSAKALFYDPNLKAGTLIYSDDASFDPDTISTIKQSTSKFQKPTFHRTVVNGEAQTYPIPERTTYWFSAVEGMDDDQLANRFLHADVDGSRKQDELVHQHQKDSEEEYEADETDPDVLVCRCIFSTIFSQTFRVKIPFVKCIQWNNTENRRNFEKFTDVIRAVTIFNYRQREVFEGFLMATVDDYERGLKIYKGTSVNNATNLTNTELEYIKYIVGKPGRTFTQKELVEHFKVTEAAVRRMLNGRKGDGGLLAKVPQLVTEVKENTREKVYRYTGELTSLDMYASVSTLDYSKVEGVTNEFKARLLENKARVTRGNQGVTKPEVTPKNSYSSSNNIINNIGVTMVRGYAGDNNLCASPLAVENNTHTKIQVTPISAESRLPLQGNGNGSHEEGVTIPKLPLVTLGYPQGENNNGSHKNDGYPSADNEAVPNQVNYEEAEVSPAISEVQNQVNSMNSVDSVKSVTSEITPPVNLDVVSLLNRALVKFAWDEYKGIVPDIDEFTRTFNKKVPEYRERLGRDAVGLNADKLRTRGWRM